MTFLEAVSHEWLHLLGRIGSHRYRTRTARALRNHSASSASIARYLSAYGLPAAGDPLWPETSGGPSSDDP